MRARDVMTREVVTVSADDLVQDVARTLLKYRISGVPVVDGEGKIVGLVSEGDLMRRAETGTEVQRPWWRRLLAGSETLANDYLRSHGRRVADIMTTAVITASPETSLRELAATMERNGIKRLPIVENDRLIGIVSRANLMQAFASMQAMPAHPARASDQELRERVLELLRGEEWISASLINVIVYDGAVELWGVVHSESERRALRVLAESASGTAVVKDNLTVGLPPSGI